MRATAKESTESRRKFAQDSNLSSWIVQELKL